MMRENSSASESSSGKGRTSRPASFPNMNFNMNTHGIAPNSSGSQSKKIRDVNHVTIGLRNMIIDKNKTKRHSLTDSDTSDTASGRSRGAGGSVVIMRQNAPNQRNMKNEKRLKEIRASLVIDKQLVTKQINPQPHMIYERVDVARETVSNAVGKKMKQETTEPNNYGEVYYQVAPSGMYPPPSHKDSMGVILSRGSPDGASYRAESPSAFHAMQHVNPNMMMNKQQHYEPVHPMVLPTGSSKYMSHPTTEPPAYSNMIYDYSAQNSCAGSDNSSSTGGTTGSQYLPATMNGNQSQHMQHPMYDGLPPANPRYNLYPEQRPLQMHYVMQDDHPTGHPNDKMSYSSQQIMDDNSIHRPIIKGSYSNPPPSYNVSQNFKNKQIQSNEQTGGIYAINSALTGNINAVRYENVTNSHHNNQPYQQNSNEAHLPSFTSTPISTIRQAVSSQPVSKPRAMTAQVPTAPKDNYYGGYVESVQDHADATEYSVISQQNPQYAIPVMQDRKPPPYISKRNSANLENQFLPAQQSLQTNNNNGTQQHLHYDNIKSDNSQKSKVAEMYLNAVEKVHNSRNAASSQQVRPKTTTKYNQQIPHDAEAAAKAARVTGSNSKRSAGSYSAASSAKQLKPGSISEPPKYPSKPIISTSPVPQRKSYRDKTGKKQQEIQRMREVYSSSEDEEEGACAEEEPRIRRVRIYSPEAFKFYMEQHMENIIKGMRSRSCRRMQLEYEMSKMSLAEEEQKEMRKMLFQKESNHIRLKRGRIHKSMFQIIKRLGVGAFGEVMLARRKTTGALFAIKILKKKEVLNRNQVAHVKAERDILAEADNDWVVRLYYTFQDREHLFFVMDYIPGGDMMSLLIRKGIFDEQLALFYTAEMCLALESVHKMGFIHRDIKPDNILIDRDGHIKLTDFGLCTGFRWTHDSKYYLKDGHKRQDSMDFSHEWKAMNVGLANKIKTLDRRRMLDANRHTARSLVGTPNYIAPEVLMREGYTELCDWWSVGVILYEMVIGQPPFNAISPAETQYKVIKWRESLTFPHSVAINPHTKELIKRLCCDKENRLGRRGTREIKEHPYFQGIRWDILRQTKPPFIPKIKHSEDTSNFDTPENEHDLPMNMSLTGTMNSNPTLLRPGEHAFFEFTFRRFFDDDGRAYQMGNEELQSGAEFVKNMELEDQSYDDKYNNSSSTQNNEQSYNTSNYYTNI